MPLKLEWTLKRIKTGEEANVFKETMLKEAPEIGGFDSETTGLHIIEDRPFVFQFGFVNKELTKGWSYSVDLQEEPIIAAACINTFLDLARRLIINLGANTKFDLHMLANMGFKFYPGNLSDLQFYIRYGHDALAPKNGGPPLALKNYTARYVDRNAKEHDNKLQQERTTIASQIKGKLRQKLKGIIGLGDLEKYFKDKTFDYTNLPDNIRSIYEVWLEEDVPKRIRKAAERFLETNDIPYDWLNRDNLHVYAQYDVVYTIEDYLKIKPVIEARGNMEAIRFEDSVLIPLFEMERVGFLIDQNYLAASQKKMKEYIWKKRQLLKDIAKREVKISQSKLLLKIFNEYFEFSLSSTNAEVLDRELVNLKHNPEENKEIIQFIETIQELRSLEKWYSTYIVRFVQQLERNPRIFTQIAQVGTVSGRVSSDFQQFPREALYDDKGEELFHPRKIVLAPQGGRLVYVDYSQVELRITAMYSILIGKPDLNLCRAYMPFECSKRDGKFYLNEKPEQEWIPTDLHSATAEELFPEKLPRGADWKHWRSFAKTYNFMKNYGGSITQTRKMFPQADEADLKRKDGAYYRTFPGIKAYHDYCYRLAIERPYAENLFGVRYYGLSGHKIINILGQGSGAFLLKWKIRELWEYKQKHPELKAQYQMNIHDENSWEDPDCSLTWEHLLAMKKIMEDWKEAPVPIIGEIAVSYTNWGEKKDISTEEEYNAGISD